MLNSPQKLTLYGFNNLTKTLSFSLYDIHYINPFIENKTYNNYIETHYNADKLTEVLTQVCDIIGANILNVAKQNYEPQGASVTLLVAEKENAIADSFEQSEQPGPLPNSIVNHLNKSHICIHTYPESHPVNGIHTFRADIEVSTCGVISPLKALNLLIHHFNPDIATLDYRVRGFTRDVNGYKHYIDHKIHSIQHFLSLETLSEYECIDVNLMQENLFHTKMKRKSFNVNNYIFNNDNNMTINHLPNNEQATMTVNLEREIDEIFLGRNN